MRALTGTLRLTAAANASATSIRSRRKISTSIDFLALLMAVRIGVTPASGSTMSFIRRCLCMDGSGQRGPKNRDLLACWSYRQATRGHDRLRLDEAPLQRRRAKAE